MRFKNYGPCDVSDKYTKSLEGPFRHFWNGIERDNPGLPSAHGCYVFGVRSSGGSPKPWYVGQSQRSFKQEVFQPHKLLHYNHVLATHYEQRGRPFLIFIARRTPTDKNFAAPPSNSSLEIHKLEALLIGMALEANRELRNKKGTKFMQNVIVPGVINTPRGGQGEATIFLKSLFGN